MHFTRKSTHVLVRAFSLATPLIFASAAQGQSEVFAAPATTAPVTAPVTAPASATAAIDSSRDSDALHFALRPALWMARVRGDTTFGGGSMDVDDSLGLNGYEATFNGELSASWGVFYEVMVDGWFFSTSATLPSQITGTFGSVNIAVGDQLATEFAGASAGGEFDVTLWQPFADRKTPWSVAVPQVKNTTSTGGYKTDLRIKAIGSLRWYSASMSVNDSTSAQSDSWALSALMPGIGFGFDLTFDTAGRIPLVQSVRLEAAGGVGSNFTDGQEFTFARAGLSVMFSATCGAEFGYRLENFTLDNNSANFDGGVQGLYLGANFKF